MIYDKKRYKRRNCIEIMFDRVRDTVASEDLNMEAHQSECLVRPSPAPVCFPADKDIYEMALERIALPLGFVAQIA